MKLTIKLNHNNLDIVTSVIDHDIVEIHSVKDNEGKEKKLSQLEESEIENIALSKWYDELELEEERIKNKIQNYK